MTNHQLHLHSEPFEYIQSSKKTIESRLYDEKRRLYRVGDTLVFINRANSQHINATITRLFTERTFHDLFNNKHTNGKFSTDDVDILLDGIEKYYSKDDQDKYSVLGIEFKVE